MLAFVMVFTGMGIGSWGVDDAWADTIWEAKWKTISTIDDLGPGNAIDDNGTNTTIYVLNLNFSDCNQLFFLK